MAGRSPDISPTIAFSEQQSLLQWTVQRAKATKSLDFLVVLVNCYLPALLQLMGAAQR